MLVESYLAQTLAKFSGGMGSMLCTNLVRYFTASSLSFASLGKYKVTVSMGQRERSRRMECSHRYPKYYLDFAKYCLAVAIFSSLLQIRSTELVNFIHLRREKKSGILRQDLYSRPPPA